MYSTCTICAMPGSCIRCSMAHIAREIFGISVHWLFFWQRNYLLPWLCVGSCALGDATESSAREEQTEESLQDWLQRSYPDVTVNANAHPAVSGGSILSFPCPAFRPRAMAQILLARAQCVWFQRSIFNVGCTIYTTHAETSEITYAKEQFGEQDTRYCPTPLIRQERLFLIFPL